MNELPTTTLDRAGEACRRMASIYDNAARAYSWRGSREKADNAAAEARRYHAAGADLWNMQESRQLAQLTAANLRDIVAER